MANKFPSFGRHQPELFCYNGQIHYTSSEREIDFWCARIMAEMAGPRAIHRAVGFDAEWPRNRRTSVVQIYAENLGVFVFQLVNLLLPRRLVELMRNNSIKKVGLNVANDLRKISLDFGVDLGSAVTSGVVDVGDLARARLQGVRSISLSALVLHLSGRHLPKPQDIRCGDWAVHPLRPDQIRYAALDAFASFWAFVKLTDN